MSISRRCAWPSPLLLRHGLTCFRCSPNTWRRGCSPAPGGSNSPPTKCCSWPAIRATAATWIEQGLLKVSIDGPSGTERILAILGPGAIVGELSTIDGLPRSASVTAVRDAELDFISRTAFDAFAKAHPEVYQHMVTLLAARLRDTDGVLAAGSFLPLKGRVARALLDLSEAFGQPVGQGRILIRQKVSQSDVAAMAGIARENVSRILNEWIRLKLISRLSGYYCLENRAKLQSEIKL